MSNEPQYQFVNPEWVEHRPHTPENERPVTPLMSSDPLCFTTAIVQIMDTGYTIIECSTEPSEEEIASVINAFELARYRDITGSEGPTIHCTGARESESYLRVGLDDRWIENFVEREFDVEYKWVFEQNPIIMRGRSGTVISEQKTAHPSKIAISMLRVVKGEIDPSCGHLKLFGESPLGPWEVEPRLTNRHLLVMKGHLKWMFKPSEDTTLIWKGFSKRPMLDDVMSGTAHPFMTFVMPLSLAGDFPMDWLVYPDSSA